MDAWPRVADAEGELLLVLLDVIQLRAEGFELGFDLVGCQQVHHVNLALLAAIQNAGYVTPALARHQAKIEATNPRSSSMQDRKAIPVFPHNREVASQSEYRRAILAGESTHADNDQRVLRSLELFGEAELAVGKIAQGRARLRAEIRRVVANEAFDVVHVRQLPMAAYATDLGDRPSLLELVDAETLASARARTGSARAAIRARIARAVERRAIRAFPIVTVVAEPDAAALRRLSPGARIEVVPNGVDASRFRPEPEIVPTPGSIVFVGAMSFAPNVAAIRWFVDEVLPGVRSARSGVTVTIVGRDPAPAVLALAADPAVTVTGAVDDVRPFLARAAVVIAPMVSGSGIKNKILEAMAMQRPVVATSLAAEGVAVTPGLDVLVADGPIAFGAAVESLLDDTDRAESIALAGRALVEARYTWEACAARYAALYAELAGRPAAAR